MSLLIGEVPNEKQLESARHLCALDGGWPFIQQQVGNDPHAFKKHLEEMLIQTALSLQGELYIVNNFQAYGVTESMFDTFLKDSTDRRNYTILESIVIGLNNSVIPHKILRDLNSAEIIALYIGIGELKRNKELCFEKSRIKTRVSYDSLTQQTQKEFPEQISVLVGSAYEKYWRIRRIKEGGFNQHPHSRGQLKERMQLIGTETRQLFLESLQQPYRRMQRFDGDEGLPNPNPEGDRNKEGKLRLVNHIVSKLSEIYEQNTKDQNKK